MTRASQKPSRAGSNERRSRRAARLDLIGRDVGGRGRTIDARRWWPILAVGVVLALGVTVLRIDLIRMRYALADALANESRLLEEQRALTVSMRRLRDPGRLALEARRLGFVPPARVIALPDPASAPARIESYDDPAATTALAALGATRP